MSLILAFPAWQARSRRREEDSSCPPVLQDTRSRASWAAWLELQSQMVCLTLKHVACLTHSVTRISHFLCYIAYYLYPYFYASWAALFAIFFWRVLRRSKDPLANYELEGLDFIELEASNLARLRVNPLYRPTSSDRDLRVLDQLHSLQYDKNKLSFVRELGVGELGRVFQAYAPDLPMAQEGMVAVKTVHDNESEESVRRLKRESRRLCTLKHNHIVRLLGVCCDSSPFCIVLELMSQGNLCSFLKNSGQHNYTHGVIGQEYLTVADKKYIARQICSAMIYLSSKRNFIHGDLATRNCLVGPSLLVKLADFELAYDVKDSGGVSIKDEPRIPIRWISLETLHTFWYTKKTDIWAFGVLVWEIFSYGLNPYLGYSLQDIKNLLDVGGRLDKPNDTPQDVYDVMLSCWHQEPNARPDFGSLYIELSKESEEFFSNYSHA